MQFDIFFSICQTEVDGFTPNEKQMFESFFDQVYLADELGFGTGWLAETHLSCEVQKQNPNPVIPDFKGEIGLNTDVLQLSHRIFARTKNINLGSAIRNILCNGGPIAHAEAIRSFLTLHGLDPAEKRKLEIGFAAGRFEFSNIPYGIRPRNELEQAAWPAMKRVIFCEAVEIFLRLLKGETLASKDITPSKLSRDLFRSDEKWAEVLKVYGEKAEFIPIDPRWEFDKVQIVPKETSLDNLRLTVGSHDPRSQALANTFLPCGVFNLSITPSAQIEATHDRMKKAYNTVNGEWRRGLMPRTVLIFINDDAGASDSEKNERAKEMADKAIRTYWQAMSGTIDEEKVAGAVENALSGCPEQVIAQMKDRFNQDDRLMLWFDFNNHDNDMVKNSMRCFMEKVAPNV